MPEFNQLSKDEIRLLREHRAQAAIEQRPFDKRMAHVQIKAAIVNLVCLGLNINPNDPLYRTLENLLNEP